MVLITPLTGVFDSDDDSIALSSHTFVSGWASICKMNPVATVRPWSMLCHPVGADCNGQGAIRAVFATRPQSSRGVWINSRHSEVAIKSAESVSVQGPCCSVIVSAKWGCLRGPLGGEIHTNLRGTLRNGSLSTYHTNGSKERDS